MYIYAHMFKEQKFDLDDDVHMIHITYWVANAAVVTNQKGECEHGREQVGMCEGTDGIKEEMGYINTPVKKRFNAFI